MSGKKEYGPHRSLYQEHNDLIMRAFTDRERSGHGTVAYDSLPYVWGAVGEINNKRLALQNGEKGKARWGVEQETYFQSVVERYKDRVGKTPESIITLGTGPDATGIRGMARTVPGAEIYVIERQPLAIEGAKQRLAGDTSSIDPERITFLEGDVYTTLNELKDTGKKFDIAEAQCFFQWQPDASVPLEKRGGLASYQDTARATAAVILDNGVVVLNDLVHADWGARFAAGSEKDSGAQEKIQFINEYADSVSRLTWKDRGLHYNTSVDQMLGDFQQASGLTLIEDSVLVKTVDFGADDVEATLISYIAATTVRQLDLRLAQLRDQLVLERDSSSKNQLEQQIFGIQKARESMRRDGESYAHIVLGHYPGIVHTYPSMVRAELHKNVTPLASKTLFP